jgi:hypothetical protein
MMRGPPLRDWSLVSLADEYAALHVRRTRATSIEERGQLRREIGEIRRELVRRDRLENRG